MARPADPASATPGSVVPPGAQPVAATAPPQTVTPPDTVASTENTKGPIPFDRHESILKNARVKAAEETTQKFRQEYAPALQFADAFEADPISTLSGTLGELAKQPQFAPAIKALAARILGQRAPQEQTAQPDQEPQPDLQAEDGTTLYSAAQMAKWRAWERQQIIQQTDARLAPLLEREKQIVQTEKQAEAKKAAWTRMEQISKPFMELPHFEAHRKAIADKTQELLQAGHPAAVALGLAYSSIVTERVLPAHAAQSQQALVASAVAKSTGATSQPGTAPAAPAGRPTSMAEGFSRIPM